jgi:elongation factor Ts
MAAISAAQVKELRERTGAGMMECKKALVETEGDLDLAIEHMRKSGLAKADKKAGRTAAEGLIMARTSDDGKRAALVEINCETDFVAKNEDFQAFTLAVADLILEQDPADIEAVLNSTLPGGQTVDERRRQLVAKIGENIAVRRFERYATENGILSAYLHGGRIGVLVDLGGGDADLAKDIAMHVAASNPAYGASDEVPRDVLDKEKEILVAQARDSGKPDNIIDKMVEGRLRKFLAEITLLGQPFVKDPDQSVGKLLKAQDAVVRRFVRLELGEGIEKKSENFAEEVMAQVRGD